MLVQAPPKTTLPIHVTTTYIAMMALCIVVKIEQTTFFAVYL